MALLKYMRQWGGSVRKARARWEATPPVRAARDPDHDAADNRPPIVRGSVPSTPPEKDQ